MIPIGRIIKSRRVLRGMTQAELAKQSGVNQSQLGLIEADRSSPTFRTVGKIIVPLRWTLGELVQRAEELQREEDRNDSDRASDTK